MMMTTQTPVAPPPPPAYHHPCGDLLQRQKRREYLDICVPLYNASIKGDWEAASSILLGREYLVRYSITEKQETPLHVATMTDSVEFVEHLVDMMDPDDLKLQNEEGNTAFCLAVIAGNHKMAMVMLHKNPQLLMIRGTGNRTPLYLAAFHAHRHIVNELYQMKCDHDDDERDMLFLKCIEANFFDVALRILDDNNDTQVPQDKYVWDVLHLLAQKTIAFVFYVLGMEKANEAIQLQPKPDLITRIKRSFTYVMVGHVMEEEKDIKATQLLRKIWKKVVQKPKDDIDHILKGPKSKEETYPFRILFVAAEMGNAKFLVELIREYPDLIWKRNDNDQTIFHVAVSYRCESVYNLLYDIGMMKDLITPLTDKTGNNILHMAAMNAQPNPHNDSVPALFQMQKEMLWYKEVKAMIPRPYRQVKNAAGQTPNEAFIKNHKDLVSEGEKWAKKTSNQIMVAAALISTIGFSVAFTIPGGYDQKNGLPIFLNNKTFLSFVILDAISFVFSSISILVSLSIFLSRYAQNDFKESLPERLFLSLAALMVSIMTLVYAFILSFFILYRNRLIWVPIVVGFFASSIISQYIITYYYPFMSAYKTIYGSSDPFKPKKRFD